ncbi:MAG TPA: S8 family serine peptidase [Terriglobales bacterium]|nr:S8 family serine peptidase [Terriglobales bacterium]
MGTRSQSKKSASGHSKSRPFWSCLTLFCLLLVGPQSALADTRLVVRDTLGLTGILNLCGLLGGCSTVRGLGDPGGQLFMIQIPPLVSSLTLPLLQALPPLGLVSIETDQIVQAQGAKAGAAPSYLTDKTPITYYGTTVWRGYVYQTGNRLIQTDSAHAIYKVAGSGVTVAVIDTGVDPNHPVLKNSLVTGYDFTRNQSGGSEMSDLSQSTVAVLDSNGIAQVNQSTVAVLDQSTVAVLDGKPQYSAFGHGTMVAGIVHLVAPQASIMPLKSFYADGTGYNSDILRAIYYATNHGAKVINMSFNYASYSSELDKAVSYATQNGVVCVAAAGNSGMKATVYPAALKNVIDVASTSNTDLPSTFSNYGAPPVWLAAPGEGVMTTYPFGTYAAGWGTSFSAPLVAGTTAMMISTYGAQVNTQSSFSLLGISLSGSATAPSSKTQAANALTHAQWISAPQLGYGRLDTYQAEQAWRSSLGLQ